MIYAKKVREISLKDIKSWSLENPNLKGLVSNGSIADMDYWDEGESMSVELVIPNQTIEDRADKVIKAKTFDCRDNFIDIWEDNRIHKHELLISWLYHHNHLHLDGEGELRLKLDLYL